MFKINWYDIENHWKSENACLLIMLESLSPQRVGLQYTFLDVSTWHFNFLWQKRAGLNGFQKIFQVFVEKSFLYDGKEPKTFPYWCFLRTNAPWSLETRGLYGMSWKEWICSTFRGSKASPSKVVLWRKTGSVEDRGIVLPFTTLLVQENTDHFSSLLQKDSECSLLLLWTSAFHFPFSVLQFFLEM